MDLWHGVIGFCQFMFWPTDAPWYAGGFWGNQTQWTVVTLPTLIIALAHHERKQKQRHEDLKQHITEILEKK